MLIVTNPGPNVKEKGHGLAAEKISLYNGLAVFMIVPVLYRTKLWVSRVFGRLCSPAEQI